MNDASGSNAGAEVGPGRAEVNGDPGAQGVRPFRFSCRRSGRCCTVGDGFVWIEPEEVDSLGAALGLDAAHFEARFVRTVPDPRSGEPRLALRERTEDGAAGRCALLEGRNHCSVYAAMTLLHQSYYVTGEVISHNPVISGVSCCF